MRTFLLAGLVGLLLVNVAFSLDKQRDCKCRVPANRRIVGGRNATEGSFPWQVSISFKLWNRLPDSLRRLVPDSAKYQFHKCGATIINQYWLLTAGHCVKKLLGLNKPSFYEVGHGDNDLVQIFNKKQYKPVAEFYQHPDFVGLFDLKNDIGLVKLAEPLEFSETVQPACLDFEAREVYDGPLTITGWGATTQILQDPKTHEPKNKPTLSRWLKVAEVFDRSQEIAGCRQETEICVNNEQSESACSGDSGGPIHYTKNGKSSVVGVASFVNSIKEEDLVKLCTGNMGYTRLSSFKSWVESQIGEDYCS